MGWRCALTHCCGSWFWGNYDLRQPHRFCIFRLRTPPLGQSFQDYIFTQIYPTIWNPTYHISSILRHWKFWSCKIQSYVEIADYDSWGCLWWVFLHVATEDFPRFARAIADAQRFMRRELKSASAVSQRDIIRVASWVGIGADFSVTSGWLERWWSWWRW